MDDMQYSDANINFAVLRRVIVTSFSESDLRNLAFDMDIEYESLPGDTKADKAREIIAYCRRHNRIDKLIAICGELRSDVILSMRSALIDNKLQNATSYQISKVHQLRNPVPDFIGRATEIEEIVELFNAPKTSTFGAIAIIRGLGGLGKTQLANMASHRLRDQFPDGQVFLELQGVSDNAVLPERAIQRVIQAFEPQLELPETISELEIIFRSIIDRKRVLIVADNAKDEAQIRSLVPPPGSGLLITSRQRFILPGARTFDLAALSQSEAEELLLRMCPRIKSYAGQLSELCARLPLALRVSASLLENDLTQNVATYVQALEKERLHYLRDPESPNDPTVSVSASLNLSYKSLNDARQRTLRQISVFPSSFDLQAARSVISLQGIKAGAGDEREILADLGEDEASKILSSSTRVRQRGRRLLPREEESLSILYRRSLIEYDTATERYSLHELVREFASERLKTTDERLKYIKHYLEVARTASALYYKGHNYVFEGLKIFDNERAHLDYAWSWLQQQPPSQYMDDLIVNFVGALDRFSELRFDRQRERIPLLHVALKASERLNRKGVQYSCLIGLGNDYRELGEVKQAISFHKRAIQVYKENKKNALPPAALVGLGEDYVALGEFSRAIKYYKQYIEGYKAIKRQPGAGVFNGLGLAYLELGHPKQAIEYFEQCLKSVQKLGRRNEEGAVIGNIGRAYVELGESEKAIMLCEQALTVKRQIGHRWHEGYALHFLGIAYKSHHELQKAYEMQVEALAIARDSHDRRIESRILNSIGEIYLLQGDYETASSYLEQSLEIARHIEDIQTETLACWNIALIHQQHGNLDRAIELMQTRVEYEREINHAKADEHDKHLEQVRKQLDVRDNE